MDYVRTNIFDGRVLAFEGTLSSYGNPEKGTYYLMDLQGNYIGSGYESAIMYSADNCLKVKRDGRWGVIDLNGETIFPFVSCSELLICGDLYAIENNGSYTLVNVRGEPVTGVAWEDVYATSADLIPVAKHPLKDFRSTHWGMTEAEVRELEAGEPVLANKLTGRNANYIAYEGSLMGNDVLIVYYFGPNGLYESRYIWTEEHSNESLYISDYDSVREQLTQKYGTPWYDQENWDTSSHKSYYADNKGDALCYGYLTYETYYSTDRTDISMEMDADNYEISLVIYYQSRVVSAPKADYSSDF